MKQDDSRSLSADPYRQGRAVRNDVLNFETGWKRLHICGGGHQIIVGRRLILTPEDRIVSAGKVNAPAAVERRPGSIFLRQILAALVRRQRPDHRFYVGDKEVNEHPIRAPKRPIGSRPRVIPAIIPEIHGFVRFGRARKTVASCRVQRTTNCELEKMVSSEHLRDKASRYYLLARSITSTRDIAHFEALGAEADQAAAEMEAEEDAAWLSRLNEPDYNGKCE